MSQDESKITRTKEKRKRQRNWILIAVVSVAMLFSGAWFLGQGNNQQGGQSQPEGNISSLVSSYEVQERGQGIVNLTQEKPVTVLIPEQNCLNSYIVDRLENLTLPEVKTITYEVANPTLRNNNQMICGLYALIKLHLKENNTLNQSQKSHIRGILGDYQGYKLYTGEGIGQGSEGEIEVIASSNAQEKDYFQAVIYQNLNTQNRMIGLAQKTAGIAPFVRGTIETINAITLTGKTPENFSTDNLSQKITQELEENLTESDIQTSYQSPRISLETEHSAKTLSRINNLSQVKASIERNRTVIQYNLSQEDILEKLEEINLSVSSENIETGNLIIAAPPTIAPEQMQKLEENLGLWNSSVEKRGSVRVPETILMENTTTQAGKDNTVETVLEADAEKGDQVRVRLQFLRFQGQAHIVGAKQVNDTQK